MIWANKKFSWYGAVPWWRSHNILIVFHSISYPVWIFREWLPLSSFLQTSFLTWIIWKDAVLIKQKSFGCRQTLITGCSIYFMLILPWLFFSRTTRADFFLPQKDFRLLCHVTAISEAVPISETRKHTSTSCFLVKVLDGCHLVVCSSIFDWSLCDSATFAALASELISALLRFSVLIYF